MAGAHTPVALPVPVQPGYVGVHAVNTRLADLKLIDLRGEVGPEHIVIGPDGKLYTTVASGNILRMNTDGTDQQVFANSGGRILGFDFDAKGNLIAADAVKGLLSIAPDAKVTVLTDKVNGDPIRYADAVVVAKNGKMYFSDASTRFAPKDWGGTFEASVLDIIEQAATGRILEFDPATQTTRVVALGISFANGVALSQDEQALFVNETGRYRVWKIAVAANALDVRSLGASGSPQARIFLDNLPDYPDNLMRGLNGKIWLGFAKPGGRHHGRQALATRLDSATAAHVLACAQVIRPRDRLHRRRQSGGRPARSHRRLPRDHCHYRNPGPPVRAKPACARAGVVAESVGVVLA